MKNFPHAIQTRMRINKINSDIWVMDNLFWFSRKTGTKLWMDVYEHPVLRLYTYANWHSHLAVHIARTVSNANKCKFWDRSHGQVRRCIVMKEAAILNVWFWINKIKFWLLLLFVDSCDRFVESEPACHALELRSIPGGPCRQWFFKKLMFINIDH